MTIVLADVTHLRRLDEMKSGMLSVVSHELKTPLTSIRMGVHLLLEERIGSLTSEQGDILAAVREDSDRLNTIVENLLDMGRIESGRALVELKPVEPEQILAAAAEQVRSAFADKGVDLEVDAPASAPAVMADRAQISHVFSNLLNNALKYTPPGGKVRLIAEAPDGTTFDTEGAGTPPAEVRFSVSDTGKGIPQQYCSRIFERFFRVPGQPGSTGAGLGLAIAKEIVEAHGGRISVSSVEGQGSQFTFTLKTHLPIVSRASNAVTSDRSPAPQERQEAPAVV